MSDVDAGRALDALVAESMMGWKRDTESYTGQCYIDNKGAFRLPDELPHYSTNIGDAWLVVEKMRDRLNKEDTFLNILDSGADGWRIEFVFCPDHDAPFTEHASMADTAPLAICLASLEASQAVKEQEKANA